ncbi:hypothetical protein [Sphingomonas sp. LM7]|uniref:hypothetical protein n=1 Tax=Sphingomonas sp. LM7 TaxID=1938607 RepID=UPI000983FC96|nr:hypothetical protein [Sphingomonas sp. LM7]AQR72837.1 hypothetical protein BXU08_03330 [Sphingomonas sp. LM7]
MSALVLAFAVLAGPAQADTGPQVDLNGYVKPRCWVANPATFQPSADMPAPRPHAICNQSTPMLRSNVRTLNADGTLAEIQPAAELQPTQPQLSGRAALEIVVSPQL